MEEQDNNITDITVAHNTRKNARKYEPSKTSFFRLDEEISRGNTIKPKKWYHRHKQETYQQERMEPCIFVIFAIKKYKSQSGLKRHQKNCTQSIRGKLMDNTAPMEDTLADSIRYQITSRFKWGK